MTKDGTATQQDVETSAVEPETSEAYTKTQVDHLMDKVRSDSLAELGRVRKASEEAIRKATDTANQRLMQLLKERDDAEVEAAKEEPDRLVTVRARQETRRVRFELDKAQSELDMANAKLAEVNTQSMEQKRQQTVQMVASKFSVDGAILAKLAKFTDGSAEVIEDIAKTLSKTQTPETAGQGLTPDSNRHHGGSPLSIQKTRKDYAEGRLSTPQYVEQCKALGVRP